MYADSTSLGFDRLRTQRREAVIVIVQMVHQEAARDDVAAGDVGLEFGQVADAQKMVIVGIGGEFGVNNIVVFALHSIVEPNFPFFQRTGKG